MLPQQRFSYFANWRGYGNRIGFYLTLQGKELAKMFAKFHKCTIIIFDIRDDLKSNILSQIQKEGGKGFYYNVDVSEGEVLETTVQGVLEKFKKVDLLINNAGILNLKYFSDSNFEEFRKVAQVNFLAPIQLISLILPQMITQNRGQIVNISSVASILAGPKMYFISLKKKV